MSAKRRKERQNQSAFEALIASPVVGAVTLPADAKVAFRSTAGALAGATAATTVGPTNRTFKTPALSAGEVMFIDHLERGTVVTAASGFDVLVHIGFGRYAKIAGVA